MLKRIDPADVVLGMYIHKLKGNWFSHPYWRANFLLTDQGQLDRLHASRVPAVIIDTDRGIDTDVHNGRIAPLAPARRPVASPLVRQRQFASANAPSSVPTGMAKVLSAPPPEVAREFGRASAVADRALKVVANVFLEMRLGKAITPATISPIITSIITSVQRNPFAFNGMMCLRRDSADVYRHALATSALMIALGRNLRLSPDDLTQAGQAGLLLDAGVSLLQLEETSRDADPRSLPPEIWRSHVQLGHDFILRSRLPDSVARACLEHHERIDSAGWPNGTGGAALGKLGRMAAICDTYDVLVSGSEGRPGFDPAEAMRRMKTDPGAFDPDLLAVFETTIGIWPTGSVVELRSGRLAVVIEQHRDAPDRPLVGVFYDPASAQRIDGMWIDLHSCYGADAIAGPGSIAGLPHDCQASASAALFAATEHVAPGSKHAAGKAA